jgi:hypothetical protein
MAGGVWVDPSLSIGKRRYVNDSGWMPVSNYEPPRRTRKAKEQAYSRRSEDWAGTPEGRERRSASEGGKIGYQYEQMFYNGEGTAAFLAHMKRSQARARVEGSARQPKRRTPRGTQVEGWMGKVNGQMEARRGT